MRGLPTAVSEETWQTANITYTWRSRVSRAVSRVWRRCVTAQMDASVMRRML
jgi:hypothetical protein